MKLNCDLGEGFAHWQLGNDAEMDSKIMPFIHMANIACGFHASDPVTMNKTVTLAKQHNVIIGAHPSYPDLQGFGRRSMAVTHHELTSLLHYQVGALQGICAANGMQVSYVKPHGALYNDMMKNSEIFSIICKALSQYNKRVQQPLYIVMQALPNVQMFNNIAQFYQLEIKLEAFADRHYQDDGLLVPRAEPNATILDIDQITERCRRLMSTGKLESINGKELNIEVDTLCIHGDHPAAVALAKQLFSLVQPNMLTP